MNKSGSFCNKIKMWLGAESNRRLILIGTSPSAPAHCRGARGEQFSPEICPEGDQRLILLSTRPSKNSLLPLTIYFAATTLRSRNSTPPPASKETLLSRLDSCRKCMSAPPNIPALRQYLLRSTYWDLS